MPIAVTRCSKVSVSNTDWGFSFKIDNDEEAKSQTKKKILVELRGRTGADGACFNLLSAEELQQFLETGKIMLQHLKDAQASDDHMTVQLKSV